MNCPKIAIGLLLSMCLALSGLAAPVIDPIADVTIPAGKSIILPITATSPSGLPLTYTILSSTNAFAVVMHTNNPFWQLSVAQAAAAAAPGAYKTPYRGGLVTVTNVGTMTFMLFPEYAPHTVNVFQGLTDSGFYNSNTIFHRVVSNFVIQGGDPKTNGTGGLVFQYDDEFNPQAIFSGNGQLALANSGKNTDGSQFFVTVGPQRYLDFGYTLFGQMVRGFDVLTNISLTAVNTNTDRPLADEIIQTAGYVTNTADTVLTLTATNIPGATGTITVIADDGNGGLATNMFAVTAETDAVTNYQAFIYPNTVTNLVAPVNTTLTNFFNALELNGAPLYWFPDIPNATVSGEATNSTAYVSNSSLQALTYNVINTNGEYELLLKLNQNFTGPVTLRMDVSYNGNWSVYEEYGFTLPAYDENYYTFAFGDTSISGQTNTIAALATVPFTNVVLATFTNGVPGSAATNFSAFINWGDDTTNRAVVVANAAGLKEVLGSHTYAYSGSYPVYVTVQSRIGASATVLSYVNVTPKAAAQTNVLAVQVTGLGTVSSNYINAPLAAGGNYSITATPAAQWSFVNWTDGNGYVLGVNPTLSFTMYPGLSLTANFTNKINPVVTITNLKTGQQVSNSLFTVLGTVTPNWQLAVQYQLNYNGWNPASGTTNWLAAVNLNPGTNIFQVYAADGIGTRSLTNTITINYVVSAPLQLSVTGLGTITPNDSNALLQVNRNYTLTATAAAGFAFTSWTGSYATNKAALTFTMESNVTLTANFTDVTRPTVAITNLVTGQRVSNSVFVVRGKASDNWQLAGVEYQLNYAGWNYYPGGSNWFATLNLQPGTNIFQVFAVDSTGNYSLTNTAVLDYVVSAQLQLQTTGLGTITPNDSNVWLAVGQNYTLSAKAATGFAFTSWTGSYATNKAALTFTMESNVTLTANFTDVTRPTVAITNLVTGQRVSNSTFTVRGKASDNWQLAGVEYQLNYAGWNYYPGGSNWFATLNLSPGTNVFQVFAVDSTGNYSLTNTAVLNYVVSAQLQLQTTGVGTITPNDSNAWLAVGQNYTLTAVPAAGFAFTNWTGSYATNKAALTFTMESNVSVTANFVDVTRPTISIANLVTGQRVSNSVFTVTGKAGDNWQLGGVEYQLNYAGWNYIIGETNWSTTTLNLQPGTNIFQAFAYDTTGNHSLTNTVYVDYVTLAQLLLQVSGSGTVSPNYSNAFLEVGRNYTMTATPAKGWIFYNWLNSDYNTLTNSATLTFQMNPGQALTANFHQPPTILVAPSNTLAFYDGGASFSVVAGGTGPLYYQWQFNSGNLSGENSTNLVLSSLTAANAGSYRVVVNSYSQSVTSSVAKLTLTNAPAGLAGFDTTVTPAGRPPFEISFGTNTFNQFPLDSNLDDSMAGGYGYAASGALSGQLSMTNEVPPDAVSNGIEVVDVTFVSPGWAVFTNDSASGTIQYHTATNLTPKSWSGHVITFTSPSFQDTSVFPNSFKLTSTNDFTTTNYTGTYTAATFSPMAAWLQLSVTGEIGTGGESGGVAGTIPGPQPTFYLQLQFTTVTGGNYILANYGQPAISPLEEQQGTFTWK